MVLAVPLSVTTNGTTAVRFFTTFTDYMAPTAAEVNAVSMKELSCYITGDGLNTDAQENTVTDDRLCSQQTFEQPGDHTRTLELTYIMNPASSANDVARTTLAIGTQGYIGIRWGVLADNAWAAGDKVDIYPVKAGAQRRITPGRNGIHKIIQKFYITGKLADMVAVAA